MGRILHLEWDILSCQVDDHSWIMLSWLWRLLGDMFEKELYSLMSSANSLAVVEGSKESVTSLMKTLNKSVTKYTTLANAASDLAGAG